MTRALVALDGPDGAGKSMQARRLVEWARGRGLSARAVGKWEIFDHREVPEARFLRGTDQREFRVCIAEMSSPARMLMLSWMNTLAAERARVATEDLVVLDGYWVKHAASELLMGCDERLVEAMTDAIAAVDLIVYMDVTPDEALRRKAGDLSPYECGTDAECDPNRFLSHQAAARQMMLEWARRHNWAVVGEDTPEATQRSLRDLVSPQIFA